MVISAMIISVFSILVLLAILLVIFFYVLGTITTRAPFVPLPKEVLSAVWRAMKIKKGSIVYDLGCGDGRVLIAGYEIEPEARFIGFDKNFLALFLAWFRLKKNGRGDRIKIFQGNFFRKDLSAATHIFTYLFPEVMDDLLPKLEKELGNGTRLVSCDFCFTKKKPIEIIDLLRSKNALGKKLFVYEF